MKYFLESIQPVLMLIYSLVLIVVFILILLHAVTGGVLASDEVFNQAVYLFAIALPIWCIWINTFIKNSQV